MRRALSMIAAGWLLTAGPAAAMSRPAQWSRSASGLAPASAPSTVVGYGDAAVFGSPAASDATVAMTPTRDGKGYWTVDVGGSVSAFGDAHDEAPAGGSMAVNAPVVGMAATPDGGGYWLVASDGGIFAFGDAHFEGSAGGIKLNAPVVGMAATPAGGGYWLVASDGGIFAFGDARFEGSGSQRGVVGIASTPDGGGYWTVSSGQPLAGKVVAIDPGHDGGNAGDPAAINAPVFIGNGYKACDTVGTETADGYTEHAYNFDVAMRLQALLQAEGATVVLTRTNDTGVGPCIDQRAAIGNNAHAAAAVSIHADGGPVGGRGFTVIEPLAVGPNNGIIAASDVLGSDMVPAFEFATGMPTSTYDGTNGISQRSDLGGLNLSTVPKVLVETGNMQNPTDAALLEDGQFRQQVARGLAAGITDFLTSP